jgi:2-C-methyl-D-erythritol 4-phosphate cytidylyltransferase
MKKYLSVILLCGGRGIRMGSSIPKQFLPLKNKILALHSFDFFCQMDEVSEIVIVCPPKYNFYFKSEKVLAFAPPGIRRQDSVTSGFKMTNIKSELICIHDSARPFLQKEEIKKVINAADDYGAAALGRKVKNTIKKCQNGFVEKTIDRETLYEIYTPQIIKKELLNKGLIFAEKEKIDVTDDLSLLEKIGYQAKIIDSAHENLKITTPLDLKMAEALLSL